jgi:hypothetical protein
MAQARPRVVERSAYDAGHCTGCKTHQGRVFEIDGNGWITRFCRDCLEDIMRQAGIVGSKCHGYREGRDSDLCENCGRRWREHD